MRSPRRAVPAPPRPRLRVIALGLAVIAGCGTPGEDPNEGDDQPVAIDEQRSCASPTEVGCGVLFVPASDAPFRPGHTGLDGDPNEPKHDVTVSAIYVDVHEVTVGRFRRFAGQLKSLSEYAEIILAGGETWSYAHVGGGPAYAAGMPLSASAGGTWTPQPGPNEAKPITGVSWGTAMAFCHWDSGGLGRLPSEMEYEYLLRFRRIDGTERGRPYAWGSEPVQVVGDRCDRAQVTGCPGDGVQPVGSFPPAGGLYDLTGNAAEWPLDRYSDYPPYWCGHGQLPVEPDPYCFSKASSRHAARGGSFATERYETWRRDLRPTTNERLPDLGFRCVRSAPAP